jgi:PmbA protein
MNEEWNRAERALDAARAAGATDAQARVTRGIETSILVRDGRVETVEQGSPRGLTLEIWRGDRSASGHTSDLTDAGMDALARELVGLADLVDPVPEQALPPADLFATEFPELDLYDPAIEGMEAEAKVERVRALEAHAMSLDARLSRSAGASWGDAVHTSVLANTAGFSRSLRSGYAHTSIEVIADDAGGKKRNGSWHSVARHVSDFESLESVAARAVQSCVRTLGARSVATFTGPVVFDAPMASSLLSTLYSVICGAAVERRASLFADRLGERIGSDLVQVEDDPFVVRGLGSRPFDGEGLAVRPTTFIEAGILRTFALSVYHARRLGRAPTGHGSGGRGEASHNLRLRPGTEPPEALFAGIERGLWVTSMMGFGFNPATGDFSRGASGFLIENGVLTQPVSEVTVSSNLAVMLENLDAVANDLPNDRSVCAPTFRIASMTVAGEG